MKKTSPGLNLDAHTWDASRLGEAVDALARQARLAPESALNRLDGAMRSAAAPRHLANADAREQWVQWLATQLGIEAEPVDAQYADVDTFVRGVAPAIIEISADRLRNPESEQITAPRLLILLKSNSQHVTLLTPELTTLVVAPQLIHDAICHALEAPLADPMDQLLVRVGVSAEQLPRARQMMLAEQLSAYPVARGWILRMSPGASSWRQLREARVLPLTAIIFGASLAQQTLTIFTWAIIGQGALAGKFDWTWMSVWAILLLMGVPLQMFSTMASAHLGTNIGATFKTSLLYGALKLSPEEIRHEGAGTFLSRMLDADKVEFGAIASVVQIIFAIIQIFTAFGVVWLGVGGWVSALMLALVVITTLVLGFEFWRANDRFVDAHRGMTNHLVERMVGYRTRLAQQDPAQWHTDEDAELAQYLQQAERQARTGNWLAMLPRLWMVLGLASIAPSFIGQTVTPETMAISLGGILLAEQALNATINNLRGLVALGKAWQQIKPLFDAARRPNDLGLMIPDSGFRNSAPHPPPEAFNQKSEISHLTSASPLISMRDVSFRYRARTQPALEQVTLDIRAGDRLLVEGPSGGGKSTLAAVISGLRRPESGLLLLRGYDRASVGQDVWRKHVVVAPQFHENYVFTGTFGFNLLMGRRWPATPQDGAEAIAICDELGLNELIAKMPSGTQQMVGDHGWQLSHGERSRLYIARALLQRADLIILDESFAALDPENLERALRCVFKRAPTLLVIAHP